ncbi:hypothetical protein RQP46_009410 [Phenoliferia psychrophenolica]
MSSEGAVEAHAFYCFEVINATLTGEEELEPAFDSTQEFPLFVTWNLVSRSTGSPRLRGCIGNFEAAPIKDGLRDYAGISAFKDHRFAPISTKELPRLECGVSLLTDFELCDNYLDWAVGTHGIYIQFANPALAPPGVITTPPSSSSTSTNTSTSSLASPPPRPSFRSISQLPPFKPTGLRPNPRRLPSVLTATYLPDVPGAQGWDRLQAVDSAIHKAGWTGSITEELRNSLRVTRYQSRRVERSYAEWRAWREAR